MIKVYRSVRPHSINQITQKQAVHKISKPNANSIPINSDNAPNALNINIKNSKGSCYLNSLEPKSFKIRTINKRNEQSINIDLKQSQQNQELTINYLTNQTQNNSQKHYRQKENNSLYQQIKRQRNSYRKYRMINDNQSYRQTKNISSNQQKMQLPFESTKVLNQLTEQIAKKIQIHFNQNYIQNANRKISLIVSLQLLSYQPKKFWKSNLQFLHSYKKIPLYNNYQPFCSQETIHLLKMISKDDQSMIKMSKYQIIYKVNSQHQIRLLKNILDENNINDYYCIFSPLSKHVQQYNIYNLKSLKLYENVILMEERQKLAHSFPIFNDSTEVIYLSVNSNNASFFKLSEMIKTVQDFVIAQSINEFQSINETNQSSVEEIFQNDNYNKTQRTTLKSAKFRSQLNSTSKRPIAVFIENAFSLNPLKCNKIEINSLQIACKVEYTSQNRELRQIYKLKRNRSNEELHIIRKQKGNPSIQKIRDLDNGYSNPLNQDFKEKLVKLVKILEEEKSSKLMKRQQSCQFSYQNEDQLNELTFKITQSSKGKTPYQLVSQIIKNNNGIQKQIDKYLNEYNSSINPFMLLRQQKVSGNDKPNPRQRKYSQDVTNRIKIKPMNNQPIQANLTLWMF